MLISYMDYFYQTLTQIRIWALSDNQDVHHLSVCACGHLLRHLSPDFFQISYRGDLKKKCIQSVTLGIKFLNCSIIIFFTSSLPGNIKISETNTGLRIKFRTML